MPEGDITLNFVSDEALQSELRLRRPRFTFKTVPKPAVAAFLQDGWEIHQKNANSIRLRKPKPPDQMLEDEIWTLLARIGFTQLSRGRTFTIPIGAGIGSPTKQIDVLAADDETAIVVECKTSTKAATKSMAKDLNDAYGVRSAVIAALRNHYGIKKKIGWVFATRGIGWGQADRTRADEYGIRILTDNEIDYYLRLADLIGPAARHQLQAEVFGDRKIDGLNRRVLAVRGQIAGRRFFQFTIEPERLLKIAYISHRQRLDEESVAAYQRMLKKNRLASIRTYIEDGGVFPTNVVVNFRSKCRFDASGQQTESGVALGTLYLPNTYKSAWVIDGQHRLYGFAGTKWAGSTQLPVLAFEELPPEQEARMFVDINNKQVRVQRNLLVELQSELYWGSPIPKEAFHALLSRIVAVLSRQSGSPLRGRTVEEGDTQSSRKPITTTGLYEAIRKTELVGQIRRGVFVSGPLYEVDDHTALKRSVDVVAAYFRLFADALPDHWALGNAEGGFLCTNNGLTALLAVLEALLTHLSASGIKTWQATPDELLDVMTPFTEPLVAHFKIATVDELRAYRRQVGNLGQSRVAFAMMDVINNAKPSFSPTGLDEYRKSHDQTGTNQARILMPKLQLEIQGVTLRILKSKYGPDEAGWWRQGVPPQVRQDVAALREANPELGGYEQNFDLLDYRSIASAKWELFEPFFAVGGGNSKEKQLGWFSKLSILRNRIAHPERGPVSDAELAYIQDLLDHFADLKEKLPIIEVT